jgi:hypothetical protein
VKKLVVLRPMGGEKQARKDQPFPDMMERAREVANLKKART